jgi:hypothetical protein
MPRPAKITHQGNGSTTSNSNVYPMNYRSSDFQVGLGFTTDGTDTSFTVQYAFEDVYGDYANGFSTDATWYDHPTLAGMTADDEGSIDAPVTAVRLQANATATDTGTLFIVQSGY